VSCYLCQTEQGADNSLLAFISIGIPLLVLLPMSSFVSKTRWDIHNAMIGMSTLYSIDKADDRSIHVIHNDRSRHPNRQGTSILIGMSQADDSDDGWTTKA
jgi:hypothetical protein